MIQRYRLQIVSRTLFCFFLLSCLGCSTSTPSSRVGTSAPYTRVLLVNGEHLPLPLYDNRRVALMFWASWCPRSRSLIGEFEEAARDHASSKDLWFLAVSVDRASDEQAYLRFLKEQNLTTVSHAFSGNAELDEAYLSYGLRTIPYFYLLGVDGTVLSEGNHPSDLF